jgi:hypothetical protein
MQGSAFGAIIDIVAQHEAAHAGGDQERAEQRVERSSGPRRRCSSDEDWGLGDEGALTNARRA